MNYYRSGKGELFFIMYKTGISHIGISQVASLLCGYVAIWLK